MILGVVEFLYLLKNIQYYVEPACFFIVILLIYQKYHGTLLKQRPLFNSLLLLGFSGWFLYSILDIFIFELAWEAVPLDAPIGVYSGYTIDYPKLFAANVMRDFAIFGAMLMNWTFLIASYCMKFGEIKTKNIFFRNKIMLGSIILSTIIIVFGDQVAVTIWDDGTLSASAFTVGLGSIFIYIAIGFYIFAGFYLISNLHDASKEDKDPIFRRKILLLSMGIIFMGIAFIFWVVYSFIGKALPLWASQPVNWLSMSLLGHFLWMLSPIFVIIGLLYKKSINIEKNSNNI